MSLIEKIEDLLDDIKEEINQKDEMIALLETKAEDLQDTVFDLEGAIEDLEQRIAELELAA